ncbi:MAG: imidazoleglycerol-phosphate dehydratase, partial [Alphaproteobacteria bacterium]|nr:imidazoleglycerol-phosphate dehydratase [Alphaproteobacteria bacterium]
MTKENPTPRQADVKRQTNETSISAHVNLDGTGKVEVSTGLGFFDHMIEQLGRHSLIDITLNCQGDL